MAEPLLMATDSKFLFSKNDTQDPRLGDLARITSSFQSMETVKKAIAAIDATDRPVTLVGYPDDEGIKNNGGRVGASEGPDRIRTSLYKMTPPAFSKLHQHPMIYDFGNLNASTKIPLEKRHEAARGIAASAHAKGLRTLSFGGGHDYGFPDAAAFSQWAIDNQLKPLVINFDAHLDVRPLDNGITSGTPFFRLLEEFPDIDFIELGLQGQCNARSHLDWLLSKGGQVSFEEERRTSGLSLTQALLQLLGDRALGRRSVFLSIDIDAFSSSVAPGASQSWPTGFMPDEFFDVYSWCLERFDVRGVGIYEVSPRLDVDDRTSRLGALIAHRFVFQS